MRTVPRDFAVHSMHCYFVLAGDSEIPVIYHVERVRDGRSFITRTVQARQRGRPIFTTTLSFSKVNSGGKRKVEHATPKPAIPSPDQLPSGTGHKARIEVAGGGPFESRVAGISNRMLFVPLLACLIITDCNLLQAIPPDQKTKRSDASSAHEAGFPKQGATKRIYRP